MQLPVFVALSPCDDWLTGVLTDERAETWYCDLPVVVVVDGEGSARRPDEVFLVRRFFPDGKELLAEAILAGYPVDTQAVVGFRPAGLRTALA